MKKLIAFSIASGVIAAAVVACVGDDITAPAQTTPAASEAGVVDANASVDAGRTQCVFQTTKYACVEKSTCFGESDAAPPCIERAATCDDASNVKFECFSGHYCGGACCFTGAVNPGASCLEGSLHVADSGTTCSLDNTCPAGTTKLCQANNDCPADQHCTPVRVFGPPSSIQNTIVAVCAP